MIHLPGGRLPGTTISWRWIMAECPVCGGQLALGEDTLKGELQDCPDCSSELEVVGVAPFSLQEAPQAEEDWGQ